jgi:hypothetical protein
MYHFVGGSMLKKVLSLVLVLAVLESIVPVSAWGILELAIRKYSLFNASSFWDGFRL